MNEQDNNPGTLIFVRSMLTLAGALALFFLVLFAGNEPDSEEPSQDWLMSVVKGEPSGVALSYLVRQNEMERAPVEVKRKKMTQSAIQVAKDTGRSTGTSDSSASDEIEDIPMDFLDDMDPDVQKAIDLIDNGNPTEAVGVLEGVLKRDPKNEQALVELAMIHLLDLKNSEQAIGYLEKVIEVNPGNRVVMSELVSLYEEEGRMDEGLQFLQQSYNGSENGGDLAHGIGQLMVMQGRDQDAVPYLRRAAEDSDNPVRAKRELAEALSRAGDKDKAVAAYQDAILGQEKDIGDRARKGMPVSFAEERLHYMKMDLARELMDMGEFDRAQAVIDELQKKMPDDETVLRLAEKIRERRAG